MPQDELQPRNALMKVSRFFPKIANSKTAKDEAKFDDPLQGRRWVGFDVQKRMTSGDINNDSERVAAFTSRGWIGVLF